MKTSRIAICAGLLLVTPVLAQRAQSPAGGTIPVTVDNYIRAETDRTFNGLVK
jgi:hypothetical protein